MEIELLTFESKGRWALNPTQEPRGGLIGPKWKGNPSFPGPKRQGSRMLATRPDFLFLPSSYFLLHILIFPAMPRGWICRQDVATHPPVTYVVEVASFTLPSSMPLLRKTKWQ